jgi:D-alanyl-D-alanine carboxypeptidase
MRHLSETLGRAIEAGLPGAFVYIEDPSGSARFLTAGVADLASQRRMMPDSRYRVGSTTKSFTAVVTLQLVAEGRLALDDTAAQRLPGLPVPNAERLTIEHLLRMRSGLFDFESDPSLDDDLDAHLKPYTLDEAVALALRHEAVFLPGERFQYCNTNYCLLEMIIQAVTGHPLADELQYRLFGPLHLASSRYHAEHDLSLPEPFIHGYHHEKDAWRDCSHVFFGRGDGALISTALDLARFFRALFTGTLLPAELLERMMTIHPDDPPAEEPYGMGLFQSVFGGRTVWGHSGGGYGYKNESIFCQETGRFVVVMQNGTGLDSGESATDWPFTPEFWAEALEIPI